MDYLQTLDYISYLSTKGSRLGLDGISALMNKLGNPDKSLKIIHIAGTNGKGSTSAYIKSILKESGYKVGGYISPTIRCYEERFQINSVIISPEALAQNMTEVKAAVDEVEKLGFSITSFEAETALAFLWFKKEGCDFAVIEAGLGGRNDATNVISSSLVSVFTSISIDHTAFLGNTIEEIAKNKADIIKYGSAVITTEQIDSVTAIIKNKAKEMSSPYFMQVEKKNILNLKANKEDFSLKFDYKSFSDIKTYLSAAYQSENASLAIEVCLYLKSLGYSISDASILKGIEKTIWEGRFQVLSHNPVFIIDGAHNADGAKKLAESIDFYFEKEIKEKKLIYIMGILADKEYQKVIDCTVPKAAKVYTITVPNPRTVSAEDLKNCIAQKYNVPCCATDISSAISSARSEKDKIIIAFGSLYYLGEVLKAFK